MSPAPRARATPAVAWRLVLTVWLVYCVHFAPNVVRETYLAITLGEHFSVRVDEYLGLHPDLFEIPGRGAYINNNPGASMLGAIPYAMARPAIDFVLRLKPELAAPKPPARYDDPRPNRTKFMNEARARGLDIKLGLAALSMQVGLMAPLGALSALLIFMFFRARLDAPDAERRATWIALLYAFGTPVFFRSAFLNQNVLIAHCVLGAYLLIVGWQPRLAHEPVPVRNVAGVGALLGIAVLTDYSGVPLLLAFGLWVVSEGQRQGGARAAARAAGSLILGGLGPLALLLLYQWAAFGNPIFPAQRYMPPTEYSVRGWFGFSVPTLALLWGNLLDLRYGLFAFCPMLVAAVASPFIPQADRGAIVSRRELAWIAAAVGALYLFSSANQFANLQWNTGVRYMVPAVPLLFIAAIPVLSRGPRTITWPLIGATLIISFAVAMTRESVPVALRRVFTHGPVLPITEVLTKMASGYRELAPGRLTPIILLALTGVALAVIWRVGAGEPRGDR